MPKAKCNHCGCTFEFKDLASLKGCPKCLEKDKASKQPQGGKAHFYERASESRGWRVVAGVRKYFINRMEADYFRYLTWLKQQNKIKDFKHQPPEFDFTVVAKVRRGPCSFYKPDFLVEELNGQSYYVETKGYLDRKSQTKLKRMGKYFRNVRVVVVQTRDMAEIETAVGGLIEGWEGQYGK